MKPLLLSLSLSLLLYLVISPLQAEVGEQAPELEISEWINGDGVTLESLQGKVVIIEFFQLWCPGCNNFSIPLMAEWGGKYFHEIKAGKLYQLSVHTVFEGHNFQNPKRLRKFVREKEIEHLVGIDRHLGDDELPVTMRRYNTNGTPAMAIVDKRGVIRFQRLGGFDVGKAEGLIGQLLRE
ncbi:MAG: TlpA family protein disulfide reductase [Gammaproteobacteria bacterium]|nr:TlpA family protein disulfide reductase [Gammaproteobacteria bacterium]